MKQEPDLFLWNKDRGFLQPGDTLKTPSRFGNACDKISNRVCRFIKSDWEGSLVEIDGKEYRVVLDQLQLTKETKIKTLSKQIEIMEAKLKRKREQLETLR